MTYWMSKEMNRCFECRKIFYVAVVTIILVVIHENQNCLFDEIPVHMRGVINYLLFLGIKYLTFFYIVSSFFPITDAIFCKERYLGKSFETK